MDETTLLILVTAIGVLVGWAITVPVHRYKEQRPMSPRDVAAEVGSADHPPPVIRASYREARCPECHHVYRTTDVPPVWSWFRGCPECGTSLPATVPLVQVGVPAAMALTVALLGATWIVVPFLWFVVVLAVIAAIDLRIWLIPYWMPWLGAAVGLVLISAVSIAIDRPGSIVTAAVGAFASFVLFFVLFLAAPGKLGFGDVRLALLLGLFLSWLSPVLLVYGLLFGSLAGLVMGIAALVARKGSRFPFGPGLALGAMLAVWLSQPILGTFS